MNSFFDLIPRSVPRKPHSIYRVSNSYLVTILFIQRYKMFAQQILH